MDIVKQTYDSITKRPHKFRVWDKAYEGMVYFNLHDTDQGYHIHYGRSIDEMPTMRSTYIDDVYGNEMYEGDIIKLHLEYYEPDKVKEPKLIIEDVIGVIQFRFAALCFVSRDDDQELYEQALISQVNPEPGFEVYRLEVLGNIFQNPEFLSEA